MISEQAKKISLKEKQIITPILNNSLGAIPEKIKQP